MLFITLPKIQHKIKLFKDQVTALLLRSFLFVWNKRILVNGLTFILCHYSDMGNSINYTVPMSSNNIRTDREFNSPLNEKKQTL